MAINGIEMITDRTLSDVEYAKSLLRKGLHSMTEEEMQSFMAGLKGCYNYTDFNRVESAVKYLSEILFDLPDELKDYAQGLGVNWSSSYDVPYQQGDFEDLEVKTDWSVSDILDTDDRDRYMSNIYLVLEAAGIETDEIPDVLYVLNYKIANYIEKSLEDSQYFLGLLKEEKKRLISNTTKSWFYSDEIYGGDV